MFSLRDDPGQEPVYPEALARLERRGRWKHVFTIEGFQPMPYGEPEIRPQIHVYETL